METIAISALLIFLQDYKDASMLRAVAFSIDLLFVLDEGESEWICIFNISYHSSSILLLEL